jgi:MFS family permease
VVGEGNGVNVGPVDLSVLALSRVGREGRTERNRLLLRDRLEETIGPNRDRLLTPVFFLITLATFAYFVSVGTLIPVLPRFVEGPLGGTRVNVGLAIGAFSISAVVLRPLAGRLSDRRGRALLIIIGGISVAASTAAIVTVDSMIPLVALRILTGLGEAFFYVGAASAINDLAPEGRRGEAVSFFSLALYSGLAVGPVLGETVLGSANFDAVWLVSAGAGVVAGVLGIFLPETRAPEYIGQGTGRLIHPAGLLPGAILATSVWGLSGFNAFVPLYALALGLSGSRIAFVIYSAVVLSIRLFGARLPDRLGHRRTARASLGISAVGLILMGVWQEPAGLFLGAIVFAVGQALTFPALMSLAVGATPPAERGAVVGTFTAFFDLAFGLGAVTLGAVSELLGYSGLFVFAGVVAAAGMLGLIALGDRLVAPAVVERRVEESCEPY